jgi:hypothetical protein
MLVGEAIESRKQNIDQRQADNKSNQCDDNRLRNKLGDELATL